MPVFEGYFEVEKDGKVIAVGKGTVEEINWSDLSDVKVVKKSNHGVDFPDSMESFNLEVDGVELVKGVGYLLSR